MLFRSGVRSDIAPLRALQDTDTLLLVDTVTGLAGIPVEIDAWGVDACYSGTQKCLGVPPGLAPVTFSDRALERIRTRTTPPQSWYLDLGLIGDYVGAARKYHHTAPVAMVVALHAGLGVLLDEGLEASWARHAAAGERLQSELETLGFTLLAREGHRLPQLTTAGLPAGSDEAVLRRRLLDVPCPVHRLLCFAPANFGSDLAAMGQSFLGKFRTTFFNSHARKQDFLESGKAVLQGLEPASPFQWE